MAARVKNEEKGRLKGHGRGPGKVSCLYLYGLSQVSSSGKSNKGPGKISGPQIAVAGIDGSSEVKAIECAALLAWVSEVDAQGFAADLNSKMENLEWLADASVRHQRAVAAISEITELLPARFGTVFLGVDSLAVDIRSRKKQLSAAFTRIADAEEWGVKVFATEETARPVIEASSGKDYLQKKARAIEARGNPVADEEIKELNSALAKIARASAKTGKVSGGLKGLQWQATFLVARNRRKQWEATLKRFSARWDESRRIECTGPWPPYSFVGDNPAIAVNRE